MPTPPRWRKSSHSHQDGDCVEVAHTLDALRDSKNRSGAVLPAPGLPDLLRAVQHGHFDH